MLSNRHLLEQCEAADRVLWAIRTDNNSHLRWGGSEGALAVHLTMLSAECRARGLPGHAQPYNDATWLRSPGWYTGSKIPQDGREASAPLWLGCDVEYHLDHQRWLLGQDPEHYRQFGWRVVPKKNLPQERRECTSSEPETSIKRGPPQLSLF